MGKADSSKRQEQSRLVFFTRQKAIPAHAAERSRSSSAAKKVIALKKTVYQMQEQSSAASNSPQLGSSRHRTPPQREKKRHPADAPKSRCQNSTISISRKSETDPLGSKSTP